MEVPTHAPIDGPGGLLERSAESEGLRQLVEVTRSGGGSVMSVEGAAGIGKTSLVDVAHELAREAGLTVLSARAGLLEQDLPWNVVRQLLAAVVRADQRAQAALLTGAASLARPALGLPAAEPGDEAGALHGLYWLTTALSDDGPVLITVDDAHWGDVPSLRYMAYLGERIADLPALLVVTVRSSEPQDAHLQALGLPAVSDRIRLRALSREASAALTRLSRYGELSRSVELSRELLSEAPDGHRAARLSLVAAAALSAVLYPPLHSEIDALLTHIPEGLPGETREERAALSAQHAVALVRAAPMGEVADLAERTLAGGDLLEELTAHELLYWNSASVLVVADRFDSARTAIESAFDDARRRGSIVGFALASYFQCLLDYRTGRAPRLGVRRSAWRSRPHSPASCPTSSSFTCSAWRALGPGSPAATPTRACGS